jgi:uncharacterized repeat protein (TIGR01451 family)
MKQKKLNYRNHAVSEVLGTILLLVISVTLFSAVYASILSVPNPPSTPSATIVGTIDNKELILEHRGGEKINLNAKIIITSKGATPKSLIIDDYLDVDYKDNGWNIGERIKYTLDDAEYERFEPVEVIVVDKDSNSIIMTGTVQEPKVADLEITMFPSKEKPNVDEIISIFITVSNPIGPSDADDIVIRNILPDGLIYENHIDSPPDHEYDHLKGRWNIGHLDVGESVILEILVRVTSSGTSEPTQLVMILDGSTSIIPSDWDIMKDGLASAIEDEDVFPRDGSVELTIIQFGGWTNHNPNAQLEIGGPVIINNFPNHPGNYQTIANKIRDDIDQMEGYTPMACGIALAADVLKTSMNFNTHRHVINIVTDGQPNRVYNIGDGDYKMENGGVNPDAGETSAVNARNYLLDNLVEGDELDAVAVGVDSDDEWLRTDIVWPQPGYIAPPFDQGPGWVRSVSGYLEFANTIKENFNIIFNSIENHAELIEMAYMDPDPTNNQVSIIIRPQP